MSIPRFLQFVTRLPHRLAGIKPGLYHYVREVDGNTARFHLRVDAAGDGLLLANAAALARLTPSGVVIAKGMLDGDARTTIISRTKSLFRGVKTEQIATDLTTVEALIHRMESPQGDYPVLNLADPAFSPKATRLARPISADVPLCPPFHMRQILDRLWQLGIPHVTIIIGRDPDERALIRALERAGDLGLITGVRGRGSDLGSGTRIPDMVAAGLDHLDVYCLSERDEIHDALAGPGDRKNAVRALAAAAKHDVCPVAQLALVRSTLANINQTLEAFVRHGLKNVHVFAIATANDADAAAGALATQELPPAAQQVEELAETLGLRLLWCPPVRFDATKTLGEQVCGGPRCGGDTAMRVEPDGSVIPARGPFRPAGSLITDAWETVERSDVFQSYRRRLESDTHCSECPGLTICAGDCPREPAGWAG